MGYEVTAALQSKILSTNNNGGNTLYDNPAPCAFCYVGGRSTVAMIPARTQCPDGWTTEYVGYLVSQYNGGALKDVYYRTSYICLDETPEIAAGETARNQAIIYLVQVRCGSLPCSIYPTGREVACIVCSK